MKYPELPKGVAAYYANGAEWNTICILVEASSKAGNKLPDSVDHFKPLAVGVSFFNPNDGPGEFDPEKGEIIATGRALKMYKKIKTVSDAAPFTAMIMRL